ncbi:glycoside hydrolase family 20 zincin-like fold domain-containing protein, partial [Streptomyces sp. NPDC006458]|uniref:glycoside hydrolase family 20 zincin-like fold domain-containing protein n=1 Tax=Streptomyces sp. NPDC006458 TaxID=3154302 RepID=UPI0033AE78CB
MRLSHSRSRGFGILAALTLAVPLLAGVDEHRAVAATLPPPPAIVPQPVSETAVSGSGFTLTAQTPVDVVSTDPDAVAVGSYLSGLLAPATGYTLPVVTSSQPQSQALVLDPNGPSSLGAEGYTLSSNSG